MVTQAQRENRALFNLARADAPLTFAQLRCASVNGLALRELGEEDLVRSRADVARLAHTGEIQMLVGWEITRRGRSELEQRLITGAATTITANGDA